MTQEKTIPMYIWIYAGLLTLFTAFMVGFSIFAPADFYTAYGINGDAAFQYSWSFRYVVVLIVMIYGLIQGNIQGLFLTIMARFFIDLFDTIGIFAFNTPEFSVGSMAMQIFVLMGPQLWCMYQLFQKDRQAVLATA